MDINGQSILSPGERSPGQEGEVSDDLLYWHDCETPVEIPQQSEESPLILEMREREQQMRRQRNEALHYCGEILRAMQRLQIDQVAVSTCSGRARHSYFPEAVDESGPCRARGSFVDNLGSGRAGGCNFRNSRLEIKGRSEFNTKTAPVQNESEANAAIFDKLSSLIKKKFEALNEQVTTSLASMNARLELIESTKRAGTDKPARQLNQGRKWYNQPQNPQEDRVNFGNCYGCGEPGHYERNYPKVRALVIRQEAGARNGPPGAAHRAGRVKAHIADKAHGLVKMKIKIMETTWMEQHTEVTRLLG